MQNRVMLELQNSEAIGASVGLWTGLVPRNSKLLTISLPVEPKNIAEGHPKIGFDSLDEKFA